MKKQMLWLLLGLTFSNPSVAFSQISLAPTIEKPMIMHGGGCRKNSPPGQCCHMDHKTGLVHCH